MKYASRIAFPRLTGRWGEREAADLIPKPFGRSDTQPKPTAFPCGKRRGAGSAPG